MNDIDVIIPTLRRPDHLRRALGSVFAQAEAASLIATIVVVDNSPEGSAAGVVQAMRPHAPAPLRYVHEPRPGGATARNAGLLASAAPLVAFLDDDEEAIPDWLGELRRAHLALGSAVTFGPVRGVADGARPEFRAYLDRFFSRLRPGGDALIPIAYGCGNSMMTRAEALAGTAPFDVRHDRTGGEDDRLFDRLREGGAIFGWASRAWVHEYAPGHRVRLAYALKRAFCYGQSPCQTSLRRRDVVGLARNMAIGAGQVLVYGAAALSLFACRRPARGVQFLDRAVRGLGKVLWLVNVHLYGLAATPSPGPSAAAPDMTCATLQTSG